jgi:hypothetical protein
MPTHPALNARCPRASEGLATRGTGGLNTARPMLAHSWAVIVSLPMMPHHTLLLKAGHSPGAAGVARGSLFQSDASAVVKLPVCVLAVGEADHRDQEHLAVEGVDDPVGADTQAAEALPLGAGEFTFEGRFLQTVDGRAGAAASPNSVWTFSADARVVMKSGGRAVGAISPKRAGPERSDRRVETLAPTELLMRGRGTARLRTPVCACSVAREGESELRPRWPQRTTAPSPRATKRSHGVAKKNLATRGARQRAVRQ